MSVRPRHIRHRTFGRLRHSTRLLVWLSSQAARLSKTASEVFQLLANGATFQTIEGMPTESAPVNTVAPTVTGTAKVGSVLTCNPGTWTGQPAPTLTYQWQRGSTNIAGQTSATYTAQTADAGLTLRCVVTATNDAGTATANSANTAAVTQTPANTVLPAITGTAQVGQVLTASNGTWTGNPAPTFARQWKNAGTNIAGATGTTYTPVAGDVGATITCTVTATNTAGSASATSAATAAVIDAA